jgi:uncharacterized protein (TIGR01777 family)
MKVGLTGGTGFVGRALVDHLRARGDDVVVWTRDPARAPAGTTAVSADLEAAGPWQDAVDGLDAIVHLAGQPIAAKRWDARAKQLLRDTRIESARYLVEAIARAARKPRVFVTASGCDYYPFAHPPIDDDEVSESDPPGEHFLARLCRDWEASAREAEPLGVRVVAMRMGLVLGPRGGVLAKLKGPVVRLGSGRQWMSWISLEDACRAYAVALSDQRYRGAINLVTDSIRNIDFAEALGRTRRIGVPAFALKVGVGELAETLLQGRRVVPAQLRSLGFSWEHPSLADALAYARART